MKWNNRLKVAVGMSGGVDSSVAAALLQEKGYDVVGITMEIFDGPISQKENELHACYGPGEKEDVQAADSVCKKLDIPFYAIDLRKEYKNHVIDYFRKEYLSGRTPNPCIVCNQKLKFSFLLEKAKEAGIEFGFFATGHYAQIVKSKSSYLLKKAADLSKDQTYFLYRLTPEQLSHTLFPLGIYTKQKVRELARSFGLETADRSESQDFIAGGDYSLFFNTEEVREGDIVDEKGNVLGNHRGIIYYTVGQRRGLGIASPKPLYVLKIDSENNRIVVGDKENLLSIGLIATELNLIGIEKLNHSYEVKTKIRLKHKECDATLFPHEKDKAKILFTEPQKSVAPGQSVVFYKNDIVMGGGIIEQAL